MGKFTDFARDEIYAFYRLTAILTTFLLAAGFAIFTFKEGELGCWIIRWSFYSLAGLGGLNILFVWWRIQRTVFGYYAKMDNPFFWSSGARRNVERYTGTWQYIIWSVFIVCFLLFGVFLIGVLISL